ncbi:hypothetical protein [Actinophytocola sp.]|uniref:hypothetical protein n=1 Tax=Actinophytocola sp. TaxID=1872138 RepID=UPI002D7F986F|nr:hypothetical protein [Actinophytocola sp.]HET9141179.1 hypothetical protein [Actinophytocola sp.]
MIGWLASRRGRISSPWLAGAFAVAYLIASVLLGVALLTAPPDPSSDATPVASTPRYEFEPAPTQPAEPTPTPPEQPRSGDLSSTEATITATPRRPEPPPPAAPTGFRQVTGPAGLRTVVPSDWRSMPSTGPGAEQATDPADATRYVKYGGAAAPATGIESAHVRFENGFAARTDGYRRIALSSASYDGHAAVEWEFEHRDGPAVKHVRSLYWRTDGKEYFLLAAAPADEWAEMKPIYDTMVANAEP